MSRENGFGKGQDFFGILQYPPVKLSCMILDRQQAYFQ